MPEHQLRTIIVEDNQLTLDHLSSYLGNLDSVSILGTGETFAEGMKLLRQEIDLLIVDLGLPDGNGIDLIRSAKQNKDTKVIVVSVFGDERNVVDAIEAGADGYLLKDAEGSEILAALSDAMNGVAPISPAIAGHLLTKIKKSAAGAGRKNEEDDTYYTLTEREIVILETLAKGFSYKEIARIQNVSFHTVNDHLKAIYRKLTVNSRGEAVYEAVRAGIIEP